MACGIDAANAHNSCIWCKWFCACVNLRAVASLGPSRHLNLALFLSVDRVATYLRERRLSGESGSAEVVEFHEAIFEFSVVFH